MGFGNPDLSPIVKKRLWKGSSKEFCLLIIYVWTLYSNHMNSSLNLSPHCTSQLASAETLKRDPVLRGGSVTHGQALSAALVPPVSPLWDRVGPTVHILNSFCTKVWKPAPYGERPMLRSSSVLSSSSLVQSTFFLLSLFAEAMICSLPSFPGSMCLPLHLLVLALCCSRWKEQGAALGQGGLVLCWHFTGTTSWGAGPCSEFKAAELPQLSLNCFLLSLSSLHPQRFITLEIYQVDTDRKWSFLVSG